MISTKFIPQKIDDCATFLLTLKRCGTCNRDMVIKPTPNTAFPLYWDNDFDSQAKRAGFVQRSRVKVDDRYICIECVEAGKASFKCELCKDRKPSNKEKGIFGDPPEFLCMDCYETVSAKVWNEKEDELLKTHRYDFE